MKTEEEIRQFCEKRLAEKQESLEALRIKTNKKYSLLLLCAVIGIPVLTYCSFLLLNIVVFMMLIVGFLLVSIGGTALYLNGVRKEYSSICKNEIISEIIKFYNTNLKYDQNKGIMRQAVEISHLFTPWRKFESRDYVEGQLGKTFIQFSYVEFDMASITYSSYFNGIFMIASFNKYFNGNYFVLPEKYTGLIGANLSNALHKANLGMPPLVELEGPEFSRCFTVYGTDPVEARYILTPSMMKRMLDFHTQVNNKVSFSFTRSRLFLSYGTDNTNIFEPSLSSPVNLNDVILWAQNIGYAINVVDEFSLNTRIWSKR